MIQFPCPCGYRFEVPDELASSSVQCPQCMRLNDVPAIGEIGNLADDGTLKLLPEEPEKNEHLEAELVRAYRPSRKDFDGSEYDLRTDFETILRAGADEIPLDAKDEVRPGAPKYDPVTGELIEPLRVKGDEHKRVIPIPQEQGPATLGYQRGAPTAEPEVSAAWVPVAMLAPINVAVMFGVLVAHFVNLTLWIPIGTGFFFAALIGWFAYVILGAHYINVVEETGPMAVDELPTPLRGLDFFDDLVKPFCRFMMAFLMCFGLCIASLFFVEIGKYPYVPLALLGLAVFMYPAVFLTVAASGTLNNLRLDRVFSVVAAAPLRYFVLVVLSTVTMVVYMVGMYATTLHALGVFPLFATGVRPLFPPYISYPLLVMGVYLMHLFCWELGLMYRKHHERFGWVLQRHTPKTAMEKLPRRRGRRLAARKGAVQHSAPLKAPLAAQVKRPFVAQAVTSQDVQPIQPLRVQPIE